MDAVFAAALSFVLAAAGDQVTMKPATPTMSPEVKRTVIILFAVALAFYLGFIFMSITAASAAQ